MKITLLISVLSVISSTHVFAQTQGESESTPALSRESLLAELYVLSAHHEVLEETAASNDGDTHRERKDHCEVVRLFNERWSLMYETYSDLLKPYVEKVDSLLKNKTCKDPVKTYAILNSATKDLTIAIAKIEKQENKQ